MSLLPAHSSSLRDLASYSSTVPVAIGSNLSIFARFQKSLADHHAPSSVAPRATRARKTTHHSSLLLYVAIAIVVTRTLALE